MKLLFLLAFCVFAAAEPKKSDVEFYNMLRQGFAVKNSIPNMWKLEKSEAYEKMFSMYLTKDCKPIKSFPYRYFYAGGDEAVRKFDTYWLTWFAKTEQTDPAAVTAKHKEWEKDTAYFLEYINPNQTMIGCIERTCKVTPKEAKRAYPSVLTYKKICILGPNKNIGMYLPINQFSGRRAGSECGPNGKSEAGLCVPK